MSSEEEILSLFAIFFLNVICFESAVYWKVSRIFLVIYSQTMDGFKTVFDENLSDLVKEKQILKLGVGLFTSCMKLFVFFSALALLLISIWALVPGFFKFLMSVKGALICVASLFLYQFFRRRFGDR